MIKLSGLCKKFKTQYKAARHFKVHQQQLQRWIKNDAHVDEKGNVYIRTKGVIKND